MEAPKFTGKNSETHTRLLHMIMFIFISNFVIFIFKKIVVSWCTFLGSRLNTELKLSGQHCFYEHKCFQETLYAVFHDIDIFLNRSTY